MKKSRFLIIIISLICLMSMFVSCGEKTPSDGSYWFKNYKTRFVAYDEHANSDNGNIDEAGTYWEMTMARNCTITITIANGSRGMFSTTYFYVNSNQVQSEVGGVGDFTYTDLSLKKGDKLVFHAFWTNSLQTDEKGFTMSVFTILENSSNYLVDLDK